MDRDMRWKSGRGERCGKAILTAEITKTTKKRKGRDAGRDDQTMCSLCSLWLYETKGGTAKGAKLRERGV